MTGVKDAQVALREEARNYDHKTERNVLSCTYANDLLAYCDTPETLLQDLLGTIPGPYSCVIRASALDRMNTCISILTASLTRKVEWISYAHFLISFIVP